MQKGQFRLKWGVAMIDWTSRAKTLLYLSFPPIFLAVSYLWGYIYYQSQLDAWGFSLEQFPITVQRTYVEAVLSFLMLLTHVGTILEKIISPHALMFVLAVLGMAGICVVISWGWSHKFVQRRVTQHLARRALAQEHSQPPTFVKRGISWFSVGATCLLAVPLVYVAILSVMVIIVMPPLAVAKGGARDAALHKEYLKWPVVSWVNETGQLVTGFLMTCSDHWCAIVQDGQSIVVPSNQVKRISQKTPVLYEH